MPAQLIHAENCAQWRELLAHFGAVDSSFLPEYHLAYALRIKGSTPYLWHFTEGGQHLIYPFLLTPVTIGEKPTGDFDISSIYGYTGPLATTQEPAFLTAAWRAFDQAAEQGRWIAEFIRFSPFNENQHLAHPAVQVSANRLLAASNLPKTEAELLHLLGSKTRNMLKKAAREGITSRELSLPEHLPAFRALYEETMARNNAPEFFWYDDAYYAHLLKLGQGLRLFGAFSGQKLVAAAMSVSHGTSALYHLGASLTEYARLGAGNLALFEMSRGLMAAGATFVNMTGGRTTSESDPLLLFKKSNATGTVTFYIGKRIINPAAYAATAGSWQAHNGTAPDAAKIIFWR